MPKILHISDTHGWFPELNLSDVDLVVHSGDFFPNFHPNHPARESREQRSWLVRNKDKFLTWLGGKPLLFCSGNHDYDSPQTFFDREGIDATDITCKPIERFGLWWYGLPYINYMGFIWNWEATPHDMDVALCKLADFASDGKHYVLVSHSPPAGQLDLSSRGEHIGNHMLYNRLSKGLIEPPRAILCGHIHECGGGADVMPVRKDGEQYQYIPVWNNATTSKILLLHGKEASQ